MEDMYRLGLVFLELILASFSDDNVGATAARKRLGTACNTFSFSPTTLIGHNLLLGPPESIPALTPASNPSSTPAIGSGKDVKVDILTRVEDRDLTQLSMREIQV